MTTNHTVVEDALDALARRKPFRPWVLAIKDRCLGCDSRAQLVGRLCPTCRSERGVA